MGYAGRREGLNENGSIIYQLVSLFYSVVRRPKNEDQTSDIMDQCIAAVMNCDET